MAEGPPAVAGLDEVRRLEAVAAAAWPPREIHDLDGWLLYASGGGTRRTESVQPAAAGGMSLDRKIDACERFYAERDARCVFRLTPASEPPGLDAALAERGYEHGDPTCVQTADLVTVAPSEVDAHVELAPRPSAAWVERCVALGGVAGAAARAHAETLDRVAARRGPSAFAQIEVDGEVTALGLAAVEDGVCFLGEIATAPSHRRRGHARAMVGALMHWGARAGARGAVLQVVAANAPARRLYAALGFVDRYRYHYRERPRA